MSIDNYKFQVACLILKNTFVLLFDQGLKDYLDYRIWQRLSPNLVLNAKIFEQVKLEAKEICNQPDRKPMDFDLFWKAVFPNLSAISTNSEIAVIKKRIQNFLKEKKISIENNGTHNVNFLKLNQTDLEFELKWIDKVVNSQASDRLFNLWQKLQFCEDERLRDALNIAISEVNDASHNINEDHDDLTSHFYESIALDGLNKSAVKDQLDVIAKLLEKGDQASLAIVGLFVLHRDQALRDVILDGLFQFHDDDLNVLLEAMQSNYDEKYREAALKIRQEIERKGAL
tara:strand:- start:2353 stop:3210 length:858 start_codon:yes stop_codon:yes gene_type:complete